MTTNPNKNVKATPSPEDLSSYRAMIDERVAKHGFAIQGVFAVKDDSPSFAYTYGLSKAAVPGVELICVCKINVNAISNIVFEVTNELMKTPNHDIAVLESNKPCIGYLANGEELRYNIVELTDEDHEHCCRLNTGTIQKVYQIFIGDAKNLLPGEEGYDASLLQCTDYLKDKE